MRKESIPGDAITLRKNFPREREISNERRCNGIPQQMQASFLIYESSALFHSLNRKLFLAGFNEGGKTWLPVHSNYLTVNVEKELADPNSHYLIYKDLIRARQWEVVRQGKVLVSEVGKGTLAVLR